MITRPPAAAVTAGLLAAFVGFTSSFSVVVQGLAGVGATPAQAASGLMALSISMGVCAILLSLWTKMPVSIAWSTPGAALLASAGVLQGGFAAAVGAFALAAVLVVACGLWRPLGRLVAAIPASIANAMLAGILFTLCLAPVRAVVADPLGGLVVVGAWLLVGRLKRLYAVPAAALAAAAVIFARIGETAGQPGSVVPDPVLILPVFTLQAAIGVALPLFLVTMASQNIPGLAILRVNGYEPPAGRLLATTGLFSLASVSFGGHAVNLAAITAAICAGDEAGPDRSRRYWAGIVSGAAYVVFGLCTGAVTAFAGLSPLLIQTVAGLALLGALSATIHGAMADVRDREAATVTFLVTASGIAILGISAPFWGLVAGGVMLVVARLRPATTGK